MDRCRRRHPGAGGARRTEHLFPTRPRCSRRHRCGRASDLLEDVRFRARPAHRVCRDARAPRLPPPAPCDEFPDRQESRNGRRLDPGTLQEPRHIPRRFWLRRAAWHEGAVSAEERRRGIESAEDAAAIARGRGPRRSRANRSSAESCARSCVRGTSVTAVPAHQGGRGGTRRQGDRRALRARHWHRHAIVRLLDDQIDDQRADRRSHPARPDFAVIAGADCGMAPHR